MPTYDAAAYQPTASGPWVAGLATRTSTGRAISGAEKLVQRFLLELMTETRSMQFAPNRGCSFLTSIRRGGLLAESDVFAAFNMAVLDVTNNLAIEEGPADPPEERFNGANLVQISLDGSSIYLKIAVHNQAGQSGVLTFPISLIPNSRGLTGLPD